MFTKLYLNRGTYKKLHSHWCTSHWMRQVFLYILIIGSCDGAYSSEGNPPITESPSWRGNSGVKARQPFRWQTFDQKHAIKSKNRLFYTLEVTCRGSVFSRCQLFSALWNGMMAVLSSGAIMYMLIWHEKLSFGQKGNSKTIWEE